MRYAHILVLTCLLCLPASLLRASGLSVDTSAVPAEWTAPAGVEVLVYSTWTRLPRSGAYFASDTLLLDGGSELFLRFDGTAVLVLDVFDASIDGGAGHPHVATGSDGYLRQWDSVGSTWTLSTVGGEVQIPPGVASLDDLVMWLSMIAGAQWFVIGGACLTLTIWSLWRRSSEF